MTATITSPGAAVKAEAAKQAGTVLENNNPAQDQQAAQTKRPPRIPMSEIRQRLQVPDIPGFRLYWFKDENVPAALDAYYVFVRRSEISMNQTGIGAGIDQSGNTDLGGNVSIIAGQNSAGQPVRLNLMKLELQYYQEDQKLIEQRNSKIMQAIFGEEARMFDKEGNMKEKDPLTYRKTALFNRPVRKAQPKGRPT